MGLFSAEVLKPFPVITGKMVNSVLDENDLSYTA